MLPAIFGLSGEALTADERTFFRDADPAGFILFARNCRDRGQLRALTESLRDLAGRDDLPVLIDQEGGRVARLKPPEWPSFPAATRFGDLFDAAPISAIEAARANAEAAAILLAEVGITVNCAPVLDLAHAGAHEAIGDRAFAAEPMRVAALGRAVLEGLAAGGVAGVVKHMPGQGRARADSHFELPVVAASAEELADDLAPFRALADARIAMTGHVLYPAWDAERCATLSPVVIGEVIRGEIGFDGLLLSDDLTMHALDGSMAKRARAALAAGCDLALHGSGDFAEAAEIAEAAGEIAPETRARLDRAMANAATRSAASYEALAAKRDALLALSA